MTACRPVGPMPLIANLRGLEPKNAESVAQVMIDTGLRIVEVPLNSADPLASISSIVKRHGGRANVGAGRQCMVSTAVSQTLPRVRDELAEDGS
jgi:2-keto-3-deoxy-6-phosphogluconate aldolase